MTPLGWIGIVRLGLVQTALGAVVVLTTSTLNRVMVVELAFPAMLPGTLVGIYYAVQVLRPRWGYGSDIGGRRTPWIIGGMLILAAGGVGAASATALMEHHAVGGIFLAAVAFALIGLGAGAAGTSLLALLASRVDSRRRAAAATIVWLMMIAGFIVTAALAGRFLDPFSLARLVAVAAAVAGAAFVLTLLAVWNVENGSVPIVPVAGTAMATSFRTALARVWADGQARRFAVFVFVSMLAYSAQDLILEPFAGSVFHMTPGESTQLASVQYGGVLLGMLLVAITGTAFRGRTASLQVWTWTGCIASAMALLGLAFASLAGPSFPLRIVVFALGVANGVFAVGAIASMMELAGRGRGGDREGVRMGLWGAAQAVAFGLGGFMGTLASDVAIYVLDSPSAAYALVFAGEACLFLAAAGLAMRLGESRAERVNRSGLARATASLPG